MEFHREKENGDEATISCPTVAELQRQGVYGWSEEFNCATIYGYLAPIPLSSLPLPTEQDVVEEGVEEEHEAADRNHSESSKKRRTFEGDEELFFKLYKFCQGHVNQYLMEMHEVRTGCVERSHLFVEESSNGKWKVAACDLAQGSYVVFPVLKDLFTFKSPPKRQFSLQDRLSGWTMEKRKRPNGKEDKFYYHGGRQFRSFVEVTTFILYSTKSKDELLSSMIIPADQNSDQVAEAPVTVSSA